MIAKRVEWWVSGSEAGCWYGMWVTTGGNIYYNTGNVGIGTATVSTILDIYKSSYTGPLLCLDTGVVSAGAGVMPQAIGKPLLRLGKLGYSQTTGDYYGIGFGYAPLITDFNCAEIGTLITSTAGNETGDLVFSTRPNGTNVAATERMRITSTGNVMIGGNVNVGSSTNPMLHVYGSDPNNIIGCFKHPNNSQGIGIGWDGIFGLGNGSGTVGTGSQNIRLVPLGTGVVNVLGNLTATGTKSWIIKHPILENKDLMHVCIEGPRADNLYRGRKQLVNGECEVNLDLECNTTGGMTEGTFVLINKNIQVFVNNNETFDKVVGKVVGNKIIVECDNVNASCFIDWLVIGERNDNEIINNLNTSSSGSVIVEIDRVVQQMQENIPSTSNTSNVY